MSDRLPRRHFNRGNPCPLCEKDHACSRRQDGMIFCKRARGPVRGFRFVKESADTQWGLYFPDDGRAGPREPYRRTPPAKIPAPDPVIDWNEKAQSFAAAMDGGDLLDELAEQLGLTFETLTRFEFIGWHRRETTEQSFWTVPMRDGTGAICGLHTRNRIGEKRCITGSKLGLFIPDASVWRDAPGPLLLVEGFSDTAACVEAGLAAIGRPSNLAGVEHLQELLRGEKRRIVVVGENDLKPDGRWPGYDGAVKTAQRLADALGRRVEWRMPPTGIKDIRQWLSKLRGACP